MLDVDVLRVAGARFLGSLRVIVEVVVEELLQRHGLVDHGAVIEFAVREQKNAEVRPGGNLQAAPLDQAQILFKAMETGLSFLDVLGPERNLPLLAAESIAVGAFFQPGHATSPNQIIGDGSSDAIPTREQCRTQNAPKPGRRQRKKAPAGYPQVPGF